MAVKKKATRSKRRPTPMVRKAGVTRNSNLFKCGGKIKKK